MGTKRRHQEHILRATLNLTRKKAIQIPVHTVTHHIVTSDLVGTRRGRYNNSARETQLATYRVSSKGTQPKPVALLSRLPSKTLCTPCASHAVTRTASPFSGNRKRVGECSGRSVTSFLPNQLRTAESQFDYN